MNKIASHALVPLAGQWQKIELCVDRSMVMTLDHSTCLFKFYCLYNVLLFI